MKRIDIWRTILVALALCLVCTGVHAQAPEAEAEDEGTFVDADGVKITPLRGEPNDLADILGVRMWNLKVEMPAPDLKLGYTLELRQKGEEGQPDKVLPPLAQGEVTPIDTSNMNGGYYYRNVKVVVALHDDDGPEAFMRVGNQSSSKGADALKEFNSSSIPGIPERLPDGSFELGRFSKKGFTADKRMPGELSLVVTLRQVKAK